MRKYRIIEKTKRSGDTFFYIQKRVFIFWFYLYNYLRTDGDVEAVRCIQFYISLNQAEKAIIDIVKEEVDRRQNKVVEKRIIKM